MLFVALFVLFLVMIQLRHMNNVRRRESCWESRAQCLSIMLLPLSSFSECQQERLLLPSGETGPVSMQPRTAGIRDKMQFSFIGSVACSFSISAANLGGGHRARSMAVFSVLQADCVGRRHAFVCVLLPPQDRRVILRGSPVGWRGGVLWTKLSGCKSYLFSDLKSLGKFHRLLSK